MKQILIILLFSFVAISDSAAQNIIINSVDDKQIEQITIIGQEYYLGDFGYDITPMLSEAEWKEDQRGANTYEAYVLWKIDQETSWIDDTYRVMQIINEKVLVPSPEVKGKISSSLLQKMTDDLKRPNANSTIKNKYTVKELSLLADFYQIDYSDILKPDGIPDKTLLTNRLLAWIKNKS